MRPLTLLDTVVDECGVPLNGRLKVFVRGETATATIYDADGREIANPQPIVNGITGHQIFIPDIDVTAEVQVLVDEALPSDDDSWECVRRIVDTYPTFDVTNDSDGLYVVNSTSELRELDPSVVQSKIGVKVATLMSSTLPPLNYRYVEYYVQPDNDGDVINWLDGSRGKWVAMFGKDYVDCRYFGIGAKGGPSSITGQDATRIPTFINRCAYLGKSPYFPADMTNAYYNIGNTTIAKAKVDVGTVFCNLYGQTADVVDTDAKFYSGTGFGVINVIADIIRTSQNTVMSTNVSLKPRITVVLDSDYISSAQWSDININMNVNQNNGIKATRCSFVGNATITADPSNVYLTNCDVHESMFGAGYDTSSVNYTNCTGKIQNWSNVKKYVEFCVANGYTDIYLEGQRLANSPSSADGVTIHDGVIGNISTLEGYYFDNCVFEVMYTNSYWKCTNCLFNGDMTIKASSLGASSYFDRCTFAEGSQVKIDYSDVPYGSISISSLAIRNCIFDNVSPVIANTDDLSNDQKTAVKGLDITNLYVTDCYGTLWNTDGFFVKKLGSTMPDRGAVNASDLLDDTNFPFTNSKSLWTMEFGRYDFSDDSQLQKIDDPEQDYYVGNMYGLRTAQYSEYNKYHTYYVKLRRMM